MCVPGVLGSRPCRFRCVAHGVASQGHACCALWLIPWPPKGPLPQPFIKGFPLGGGSALCSVVYKRGFTFFKPWTCWVSMAPLFWRGARFSHLLRTWKWPASPTNGFCKVNSTLTFWVPATASACHLFSMPSLGHLEGPCPRALSFSSVLTLDFLLQQAYVFEVFMHLVPSSSKVLQRTPATLTLLCVWARCYKGMRSLLDFFS